MTQVADDDLDAEVATIRAAVPDARRPDRTWHLNAVGVDIAISEWGSPTGSPLVLAHGGLDFAGTFDVFAPLFAAEGYRVVAWDQRGHGNSGHAALYSWNGDLRDALAVLDAVSTEPVPVIAHSKGAGLMLQLADSCPHRISHLINLDGLPSRRPGPDVAERDRNRLSPEEIAGWLDHRRRTADLARRPGTIEELAARRARMNPRLPMAWLRYLVTVGGRRDDDGWRWKADPALRFGGFGPFRPEWNLMRLPGLGMPFLGVAATEPEAMGWLVDLDAIRPYLPPGGRVVAVAGAGHFVHIEHPHQVKDLVMETLRP